MKFRALLPLAIATVAWMAAAILGIGRATPAPQASKPSNTLEAIVQAYEGESNAHVRYLVFAAKADSEGYAKVASLFRAVARSEEIHATRHAEVMRKMGITPGPEGSIPEVKSTQENLKTAIEGESYERDTMYPEFVALAVHEGQTSAARSFRRALAAEKQHAQLFGQALKQLESWRGPAVSFYVCPVCGNTVQTLSLPRCPVCATGKEKYEAIA